MLSLPLAVRIFAYSGVTDMRRSFDALAHMVEEYLGQNPESGHLFLFFNRRRDCVKILLWEGDGFSIWYKRLEAGTFAMPQAAAPRADGSVPAGVEIRASDLNLILGGVDPARVVRRPRFQRAGARRAHRRSRGRVGARRVQRDDDADSCRQSFFGKLSKSAKIKETFFRQRCITSGVLQNRLERYTAMVK
jgi:transposase